MHHDDVTLALAAIGFGLLRRQRPKPPNIHLPKNCGETITSDKAPGSAVTVGQAATEVLYSLGLGDKVKGTLRLVQ